MKALYRCLFIIVLAVCLGQNNGYTQSSDEITTFILVRHAEKLKSKDKDPDLSPKGTLRAQKIVELFKDSGIDAIFSTDYKRTRNTVKPLAEKLGLEVNIYDPRDKEFIEHVINDYQGKKILITGHSNTVPGMVNELIQENKYAQMDELEYDPVFMVSRSKDGVSDMVFNLVIENQ